MENKKYVERVRPELETPEQALRVAFTEIVSGREPEARGNGLKYVRSVVFKNPINLLFQTGDILEQTTGKKFAKK